MTAAEALRYNLTTCRLPADDGEVHNAGAVYDRNGQPHWVAWKDGRPSLCSESPTPFAESLEPYRKHKEEPRA